MEEYSRTFKRLELINWQEMPDIITAPELQQALEISDKTARKLMKELGAIKVGGRWMVSKKKLQAMFE